MNYWCKIEKNIWIHLFAIENSVQYGPGGNKTKNVALYFLDMIERRYAWRLTNPSRLTHICVSKRFYHCFGSWLLACSTTSHYLDKWWRVVYEMLAKILQWNLNHVQQFSFKKLNVKMSYVKKPPLFCLTLNMIISKIVENTSSWYPSYLLGLGHK